MKNLISQFGIIRRIEELSRENRVLVGVNDQDSVQIIIFETSEQKKIAANIIMDKAPENAYMVAEVKAQKGLGKYLYYMAMRAIYPLYLAPDASVSKDAQRVYKALNEVPYVQKAYYCQGETIDEKINDYSAKKYRWDGTPFFSQVIRHDEAAVNRAMFIAALYRRQKRLGQLVDSYNSKPDFSPTKDRLRPLMMKTDKLIKASYKYGKEYLGLPLVIKGEEEKAQQAKRRAFDVVTKEGVRGKIYMDDLKKSGMVPVYPKIMGTFNYKESPVQAEASKLMFKGELS